MLLEDIIFYAERWGRYPVTNILISIVTYDKYEIKGSLQSPVFKHRLCYYSGRVRPTDEHLIAIDKIICYSQFPRGGGMLHHLGAT